MRAKLCLSLAAGVAACLASLPALSQEVVLRLAHSMSSNEPVHQALEFFAENVNERSDGRIDITVFPSEQLGSGKDVNDMIRQHTPVMNLTDPGYLADFVPDIGVLNGPYLLADTLSFPKILESDWYAEIDQQLQDQGFRVIAFNMLFGQRHMIADKPIRSPADIEGLTVRVPPNTMWIETFEAMGARPTTVNWAEVYGALQQGVVAAAEAPLGSLSGSKLYEVRNTVSLTGHFTAWVALIMSNEVFEAMPEDLQAIMLEEGHRAGEELTRLTLESEEEFIRQFEEAGLTVVRDIDIAAFQEATASVYEAFPEWTPGLRERIMQILAE